MLKKAMVPMASGNKRKANSVVKAVSLEGSAQLSALTQVSCGYLLWSPMCIKPQICCGHSSFMSTQDGGPTSFTTDIVEM